MTETVFVTKYALSDGIRECEVIKRDASYVQVKWPGGLNGWQLFQGAETWPTFEAAVRGADAARIKRIASLKKQIAKLEKLTWPKLP